MNSITPALAFEGTSFDVVQRKGQIWLRAAEIAQALGYAREDSVSRIFDRNRDEFTPTMTQTVKLTVSGLRREIRLFSLRGAHLIAMFARTPIAKAFRRWVLDILDREVARIQIEPKNIVDDALLHNAFGVCTHLEFMHSWFKRVYPGLRALSPRLAAAAYDHFGDGVAFSRGLVRRLGLRSNQEYAAGYPWDAGHTERCEYQRRMLERGL